MTTSYRDMKAKLKKYSEEDINQMREQLAESEFEGLRDRDIKQILWDGCAGWSTIDDKDIIEQYEEIYGELVTEL